MYSLDEHLVFGSSNVEFALDRAISPLSDIARQSWQMRYNTTQPPTEEDYLNTVPVIYDTFGVYTAINFINSTGTIQWVHPFERNQQAINRSVWTTQNGAPNTAFINANNLLRLQITNVIQFFQGGNGIAVYIPLIANGEIFGFFNVVIELGTLFTSVFDNISNDEGHIFTIYEGNTSIFHIDQVIDPTGPWVTSTQINIHNLSWLLYGQLAESIRLRISPGWNSYIIIAGLILAAMLLYSGRLLQREKEKEQILEQERMSYQSMIAQYEKMNSLGTLAGGIAHEFNNYLQGIQANVSLLRLISEQGEEVRPTLNKIETLISQSKDLTNQILVFSRQSDFELVELDAFKVLEDTLHIFESTKDRRIKTVLNVNHNQSVVLANSSQLSQSYLNILKNAHDAISEMGYIEINTGNIAGEDIPTESVLQQTDTLAKLYFTIQFIDSGEGIAKETIPHIFDPFFTTKEVGRGTGLGLAMIYRYITAINGMIELKSSLGVGTRINLYLPITTIPLIDLDTQSHPGFNEIQKITSEFEKRWDRRPRILLADDEVEIGTSIGRILEMNNLDVTVVSDGNMALDTFTSSEGFDVVVLDFNMPGLSGQEVSVKLLEINPNQEILFITGFNEVNVNIKEQESLDLLQKPFDHTALIGKLVPKLSRYFNQRDQ
jgi:signal transduction histidine kinase/CheY-like chemotaxis protein